MATGFDRLVELSGNCIDIEKRLDRMSMSTVEYSKVLDEYSYAVDVYCNAHREYYGDPQDVSTSRLLTVVD